MQTVQNRTGWHNHTVWLVWTQTCFIYSAHQDISHRLYFKTQSGPEIIKRFFMLNSAEYEIFSAYKYENANNSWHFHIY